MKTYNIIPLVLVSLALFACKKQPGSEKTSPFYTLPSDGMMFKASNAGGAVKSHFQDITQNGLSVWDATDVLGVYSVDPSAEDMTTSAVKGLAYIDPAFAGHVNAEFLSVNTKAQWYGDAASRWFFATYPCYEASTQNDLQKFVGEDWITYVLPFWVSPDQEYASGFQAYQTLVSDGGVFQSSETVDFGTFRPLNALIRFRMKSVSGSSFNVGEITFHYGYEQMNDSGERYIYTEPDYAIAGMDLLKVDPSTHTISFLDGISRNNYNSSVRLEFNAGSSLSEGIPISGEYSDYFYLALMPTRSVPSGREMKIQIEAECYDLFDEHYKGNVYQLRVPAPAALQNGFEAGKCYSFAISLEEGFLSVGYEGSCNIGEYTINTEWGQED